MALLQFFQRILADSRSVRLDTSGELDLKEAFRNMSLVRCLPTYRSLEVGRKPLFTFRMLDGASAWPFTMMGISISDS